MKKVVSHLILLIHLADMWYSHAPVAAILDCSKSDHQGNTSTCLRWFLETLYPFLSPYQISKTCHEVHDFMNWYPATMLYDSVVGCLRFLFHNMLSHIAYTFHLNIVVQFMISANNRIRFGLQIVFVCTYITLSHYHYCANLSNGIEFIKCLCDIFGECE